MGELTDRDAAIEELEDCEHYHDRALAILRAAPSPVLDRGTLADMMADVLWAPSPHHEPFDKMTDTSPFRAVQLALYDFLYAIEAARDGGLAVLPVWITDVLVELGRAKVKFPDQHLPDGTGGEANIKNAEWAKADCQHAAADGTVTWAHVLLEEVWESIAETEWAKLRAELVQVIAMAGRWIEDGDARQIIYPEPTP